MEVEAKSFEDWAGMFDKFYKKLEAGTTACTHVFSYSSNHLGKLSTQRVITSQKKNQLLIKGKKGKHLGQLLNMQQGLQRFV